MCLYRDCTKRVLGGRELSFQGAEIEKKKSISWKLKYRNRSKEWYEGIDLPRMNNEGAVLPVLVWPGVLNDLAVQSPTNLQRGWLCLPQLLSSPIL